MSSSAVLELFELGFPWTTFDPFLFCVHHDDRYPAGNEKLGPNASLAGRNIGNDFAGKDGWRMYHGDVVPGFPRHPHRGFETISIIRGGFIDHSDSLGAKGRLGDGDVQWMTAGSGIVHSEMFPLLKLSEPNPTGLFQIWINLPAAQKMVAPDFTMFWNEEVPRVRYAGVEITLIAGGIGETRAPHPPKPSWASQEDSDVAVWSIKLDAGASWQLPPAQAGSNRTLYFFQGKGIQLDDAKIERHCGVRLVPDQAVQLLAGHESVEILLLQGKPIGEPVVQYGPFVMNSKEEIQKAFIDYRRTEFGGWPWPSDAPVHDREPRFALHADGRIERPEEKATDRQTPPHSPRAKPE